MKKALIISLVVLMLSFVGAVAGRVRHDGALVELSGDFAFLSGAASGVLGLYLFHRRRKP